MAVRFNWFPYLEIRENLYLSTGQLPMSDLLVRQCFLACLRNHATINAELQICKIGHFKFIKFRKAKVTLFLTFVRNCAYNNLLGYECIVFSCIVENEINFLTSLLRPPPQTRRSTRDTSATSSRRRHRVCLGHTRSPRVVNLRTNFGAPPGGGK